MNKNMSVTFVHDPALSGAGHLFGFRFSFSFHSACPIGAISSFCEIVLQTCA